MSRPASRSDAGAAGVAEVVRRHGQMLWLRGFRRHVAQAAPVRDRLRDGTLSGLTLELDLLAPALLEGTDYADLRRAVAEHESVAEALEEALLEDASYAAAMLGAGGAERAPGWLTVDLPPHLAVETDAAVAWGRRLQEAATGARVLVRVPAGGAGLRVAENLFAAGIGVYVAHLFSVEQVEATLGAYLRGLRLARAAGVALDRAPLAAAIDLVRLDVAVDELVRDAIDRQPDRRDLLESLLGRTAGAVARVAFAAREEAIGDRGWEELEQAGAHVPVLAWESTRTLSPARRDVEMLEELIGAGTASVVTWDALCAFLDHGRPSPRLGRHRDEAREVLADLAVAGIEIDSLASDLQTAASAADRDRRSSLLADVGAAAGARPRMTIAAGPLAAKLESAFAEARELRLVERVWAHDADLWTSDPEAAAHVRNRLGWLSLPETMREQALPLAAIARARGRGHDQRVVLLGMGGSSLGAEALREAFEARGFEIVDTTVPRGIAAIASRIDPERTLVVVSSKSGTTVETLALERFFFGQVEPRLDDPASRFVAVTDPGTPLHSLARERGYHRVWLAPPDVGGRYSVLSVFGMLPAALMSIDVVAVLERAQRMAILAGPHVPEAENPAARLGLLLAAAAGAGRDKLTFLTTPRLAGFADWAEQLVAESSGKAGQGIVPISREPLGEPGDYGEDRLFVYLSMRDETPDPALAETVRGLEAAGHPVVTILLEQPAELAAEFVRWELATAIACARMQVNAFDEPDVRGAKERARAALSAQRDGSDEAGPVAREEALCLFAPEDRDLVRGLESGATTEAWMRAHLARARPGDYFAILAFLAPETSTWHALQGLRALVRDRLGIATTAGWGPRFLHSTGQLHKGGPASGLFLQITADDGSDLAIPGEGHTFGELAAAQARGDFDALAARNRRVVRVHLTSAPEKGLARLLELVRLALD